jgi:hypothetical protein
VEKSITLDQQIAAHGPGLGPEACGVNTLIPAKLGFEPMGGGVRVTARDEQGATLWGVVASMPMLTSGECPVAIYDRLMELLAEHGVGSRSETLTHEQSVERAIGSLEELHALITSLRDGLDVKKPSEATGRRADQIYRAAGDAALMLRQAQMR